MSVVSERSSSHRRYATTNRNNGSNSNRSIAGGMDIDQPFLIPQFSAAASEGGVKIDINEDNWGENTTAITGNTSDISYSGLAEQRFYSSPQSIRRKAARRCSRIFWYLSAFFISLTSFISAPLMVLLPFIISYFKIDYEWTITTCEVDCQGYLLNLACKAGLLLSTFYIIYWHRATADMPRLNLPRAAFALFTLFGLFGFWLFYIVRIVMERHSNYFYTVSYALSLLDFLLFIHCIWVFFEWHQLKPLYTITIVRDPDGESHTHDCGQMSIQESAELILKIYHTHFTTYNPYIDLTRQASTFNGGDNGGGGGGNSALASASRFKAGFGLPHQAGYKLYQIDGDTPTLTEANARILVEATARRRMGGHNELMYAEQEWERRYRKRKYRLLSCAEEVFENVQAVNTNNINHRVEPLGPATAAKAVLGVIGRPLQRFLRFTRQQPIHSQQQIAEHLERCLDYGFSARTFLQRFFSKRMPSTPQIIESKWSILNAQGNSQIKHGTAFVLRSHNADIHEVGVQLYCTFSIFPFFNITEQNTPNKSKFELRMANNN